MTPKGGNVKKFSSSLLGMLALCTAAIAPSAYASDSLLVDREITVSFKLSELQSEGGTEKVYSKLKRRAKLFCKQDENTLFYFKESIAECTSDLVEQFIQSANISQLEAYHLAQNAKSLPKKFASNTK